MEIKEGYKYGMLNVHSILDTFKDNRHKNITNYLCICDCGNKVIKTSRYLKERSNQNCGCVKIKKNYEWGKSRKLINGNSALNNLFKKYKTSANRRNYSFEITLEQFENITSRRCYYCGLEPNQYSYSNSSKTSNYIYNGIDRVDNIKGYILENIVPCCKTCNFAKRNMSKDDWKDWLVRIINFNKDYVR